MDEKEFCPHSKPEKKYCGCILSFDHYDHNGNCIYCGKEKAPKVELPDEVDIAYPTDDKITGREWEIKRALYAINKLVCGLNQAIRFMREKERNNP